MIDQQQMAERQAKIRPRTRFGVSNSSVNSFLTCRRKFWFSSPYGLNLESSTPKSYFFTGTIMHNVLEAWYRFDKQFPIEVLADQFIRTESDRAYAKQNTARTAEMVEEQEQLIMGMLNHYQLWTESPIHKRLRWGDHNIQFLKHELGFEVPLYNAAGQRSPRVSYRGRFDGLIRDKVTDELWLLERKTARSISELEMRLDLDTQSVSYIYAMEQIVGAPIQGILYDVIRKANPVQAPLLQSGQLSKAKSVKTSAVVYGAQIKQVHPDWSKEQRLEVYGARLTDLANDVPFFKRIPIRKTRHEIDNMGKRLHTIALEMAHPSTTMYTAPNWQACGFCDFRQPCIMMNAGTSIAHYIADNYVERTRHMRSEWIGPIRLDEITADKFHVWVGDELVCQLVDLEYARNELLANYGTAYDTFRGFDGDDLLQAIERSELWHKSSSDS